MSSNQQSFTDKCLSGELRPADIDDAVEAWHNGDDGRSLPEFLGMTPEQYWRWVERPQDLGTILTERRAAAATRGLVA